MCQWNKDAGVLPAQPLLRATSNIEIRWHTIHNNRDPNTHSYTLRLSISLLSFFFLPAAAASDGYVCAAALSHCLGAFVILSLKKPSSANKAAEGEGWISVFAFQDEQSTRGISCKHRLLTPAVAILYIHCARDGF